MIAAHQTMLAPQSAPLPYDAEVEWIESPSTGTFVQLTDLFANNDVLALDFQPTSESTGQIALQVGEDNAGTDTTTPCFRAYSHSKNRWVCFQLGADRYSTIFNRQKYKTLLDNLSTDRISLIAAWNGQSSSGFVGQTLINLGNILVAFSAPVYLGRGLIRVYGFTHTSSGILVRDFVPVRVGSGSSAVGYLYDRVSGTIFGNAGTGAFTIGPDKT